MTNEKIKSEVFEEIEKLNCAKDESILDDDNYECMVISFNKFYKLKEHLNPTNKKKE